MLRHPHEAGAGAVGDQVVGAERWPRFDQHLAGLDAEPARQETVAPLGSGQIRGEPGAEGAPASSCRFAPVMTRSRGRTNSQYVTMAEAGFPGRPNTHPRSWRAATRGFPGWIATASNRKRQPRPAPPRTLLDEVELAH